MRDKIKSGQAFEGLSCFRRAGVDSIWEQKKLEATLREMLENSCESHTSSACCIGQAVYEMGFKKTTLRFPI
jgi:hypothetical protein